MRNFSTLVILLFCTFAIAQQHNLNSCRLSKNYKRGVDYMQCQACMVQMKKETEARKAELATREAAEKRRLAAEEAARKKAQAEAWEKRQQEIREEREREKQRELSINAQPTKPQTAAKNVPEANRYSVEIVDWLEPGAHLCKIKRDDGTITYQTDEYARIEQIYGQLLFKVMPVSGRCDKPNDNFLIDQYGKRVVYGDFETFGFIDTTDQDSADHFELVIYTGDCSDVYGDKYNKSRWTTQRHTFSFSTKQLIGSRDSWQTGSCNCQ